MARAALSGEATGVASLRVAEVACRAKRDLWAGEVIDGEGGEHVFGVLRGTAAASGEGALPMGLARGARLLRDVSRGAPLARADVEPAPAGAAGTLYGELAPQSDAP